MTVPQIDFTGERIIPGKTPEAVFREHETRYRFAGRFVRGRVVLDIACGTGIGTKFLLESGSKMCVGLDIDASALSFAVSAYSGCIFGRCDATQLCLRDESVDVVVSFETLEHLGDPPLFLQECRRVLRPGGLLICSTPNRSVYRWHGGNPFHKMEFELEDFVGQVRGLFAECCVYGQSQVTYPFYVLKRVLVAFLDAVGMKVIIKGMLRPGSGTVSAEACFQASSRHPDSEVQPYMPRRFVRPTYVVAVARKAR